MSGLDWMMYELKVFNTLDEINQNKERIFDLDKRIKRYLNKINKLKRENLVLSARRKSRLRNIELWDKVWLNTVVESITTGREFKGVFKSCVNVNVRNQLEVLRLSERIGKNGLSIQHLRTNISKLKKEVEKESIVDIS